MKRQQNRKYAKSHKKQNTNAKSLGTALQLVNVLSVFIFKNFLATRSSSPIRFSVSSFNAVFTLSVLH
jgi:hypothetical protein